MRLFLFDIDGTLVSVRGAGRTAFARALEETYGTAGAIERFDFRGRTDLSIVHELMTDAGVDADRIRARVDDCFRAYVRELTRLVGDGARVQLMPGVAEVVRRLGARPDALVGLLTGNIEAGARIKLGPTGLWPLFRVAAYGGDDADRRRLPGIARERARALGHDFPFDRITIIGDTPLDVECARGCGAVAVAVATGQHPADELATCRPDLLFGDLADVDRVVTCLTGGVP
ncbi:MAG TPA: HAD family hydrolase [Candidatus Binatia bacterium]|nr:HAD family hydrolase [Candidatus Binatia bacterium]